MRRILNVLFISFAMCLCIKTASYAENACDKETGIDIHINEYDYILAIQNMNTEELAELGMTQNDSDCVVTEFYEALNSRAALSEEMVIRCLL